MRKNSVMLFAAAGLAFASCSSDEPQLSQGNGYLDGKVSFSIDVPEGIGSRAVNDGLSATQLDYAVFDVDGNFLFDKTEAAVISGKTADVQVPLATGQKYTVAFFAKNPAAPYSIENGKLKVSYPATNPANNDIYDAFYNTVPVTVSNSMEKASVSLKRPFAQVNFAASDWKDSKTSGVTVTQSGVGFSAQVPTAMNLVDGTLTGDVQAVTFTTSTLPDYDAANELAASITVGGNSYSHVGMAYVLAPASEALLINTVTYSFVGAGDDTFSRDITSVPVKRNHRTNLVGSYFTAQAPITIVVEEGFNTPGSDVELWDGVTLSAVTPVTKTIDGVDVEVYEVSNGAELAYMAQTAGMKDAYIELTGHINLNGKSWTPFGAVDRSNSADMFTGTFDGAGYTISNFTAEASGDKQCAAFIASASDAVIKNVTIEGANVKATDTAAGLVAFIKGETKIENCNVNVNLSNVYEDPGPVVIGTAIGGLVARVYGENCVISGCTVSGTITGNSGVNDQSKIGGIVGMAGLNLAKGLEITGCTNNATMTGTSDFGFGGILGAAFHNTDVTITGCVNNGDITNTYNPYTSLTGAGGILGCAQSINYDGANDNFVITNCINNGAIKGYNTAGVGQIVGALVNATFDISTCALNGSATVLE